MFSLQFTILAETIGHIVDRQYPSKFCITIVFNFSLVLYSSQEKSKTVVMKKKKKKNWVGGGGGAGAGDKQGAFWSR